MTPAGEWQRNWQPNWSASPSWGCTAASRDGSVRHARPRSLSSRARHQIDVHHGAEHRPRFWRQDGEPRTTRERGCSWRRSARPTGRPSLRPVRAWGSGLHPNRNLRFKSIRANSSRVSLEQIKDQAGRRGARERGLCQATIKPSCCCPKDRARSPASWPGCRRRVGAAVVVPEVIFAL